MGLKRTDEFRQDAVRIALTSGLTRKQVADDLGVGMSTLNKWITAHRDTDVVSKEDLSLAQENDRHRRVGRLMRQNGISVSRTRKHKVTSDSYHKFNIAPNLLDRNFTADGPNLKWAGDISYVCTREGWLYLSVILDLHSRRVIAWAVSNRMKRDLAIRALTMAITFRQPPKGSIHHTDRGSQYCSHDYQKLLRQHGFKRRRRSGGFKIVKYKHGLSFPEGPEKGNHTQP
jgi:transposase InsO family protein